MARLESIKGRYQDDVALIESAIARAESSGDRLAEAFAAANYGGHLGKHGQFEASLVHFARAIDIWVHRVNSCAKPISWRAEDVALVPGLASSIRRSFSPAARARSPMPSNNAELQGLVRDGG